ncbi:hypothetical protein J3P77_15230 [Pseudomonas sp. R1-18]|uniref:hypothetical protein n=1 Tax=Pseudomonas sp. R1-18 TaxID=1632772 RepID=UPI003DA9B642
MKTRLSTAACGALLFVASMSSHAFNGPELAERLNDRYKDVAAQCADQTPAYRCSGLLIRGFDRERSIAFWLHDATAMRLGAESFVFLRADLSTRKLPFTNAVVFAEPDDTPDQPPELDPLCAYPFDVDPGIEWLQHGCSAPTHEQPLQGVSGSCPSTVTDVAGWIAHFNSQQNERNRQCSLDAQSTNLFNVSLQAHEGVDGELASLSNRIMIRNWDYAAPDTLPVQALVYEKAVKGALSGAQRDQLDYQKATGQWLPILQMGLTDPRSSPFSFHEADQLNAGYEMAAKLNSRYVNTLAICKDGKAAFYCNGILLRGVWASEKYDSWDPSPGSIINNGVSFSFLRKDLHIGVMFGFVGLIFKESSAPTAAPITVRCAYPFEAGTSGSPEPCTFQGVCELLGIDSAQAWWRSNRRCAFTNSAQQFKTSTDIRHSFVSPGYNEIMVAAWQPGTPDRIPLEALVHRANLPDGSSLQQAQYIQRRFLLHTGKFLPLLNMDQTDPDQPIFSYDPALQNQPGSPDSREMKDGIPVHLNEQEKADRKPAAD